MSLKDVVTHVEAADKSGGINAAYEVFKQEVDAVHKNLSPVESEKQLAEITSALNASGLLPELSLKWAQDHRFEITDEGQFSRTDLKQFQKGNDAVSSAMAGALLEQYSELRKKHGDFGFFPHGWDLTKDWFGYEAISKNDLNNAVDDLQKAHDDKVKDYNVGKSAGMLARDLDTTGDEFFNRLAKCDGEAGTISIFDISNMKEADKLMGGTLNDSERKIVETLANDWLQPYVQKLMDDKGRITPETLQANQDLLAKAEAAEAAEEKPVSEPEITAVDNGVKPTLQEEAQIAVNPGDGFDRIARRTLVKHGVQPTEAEVIDYARKIAALNNMTRESTVLLTTDKLWLPKIAS